ncbi:MAG: DedA family protein [Thermoprotei archaeon]
MNNVKKASLILMFFMLLALAYAIFYFYDLDDYLPPISGIASQSFSWLTQAVGAWSYAGLIFLMTLESASLPVPSEVILPLAGYLVYQGKMNFYLAFLASLIGSMAGSMIDYELGLRLGKSVTKLPLIKEEHLRVATNWFQRRGNLTVLLARFVIGLRAAISIPAGIFAMDRGSFIFYTLAGSAIWNYCLIYAGFILGSNWELISMWINAYMVPFSIVLIALITFYIGIKLIHYVRLRASSSQTGIKAREELQRS